MESSPGFADLKHQLARVSIGAGFVVTGQRALRIWSAQLGQPELSELCTESSRTIRLMGSLRSTEKLAAALGSHIVTDRSSRDVLASIRHMDDGQERVIEIARQIVGARAAEVRQWACLPGVLGKDGSESLRVMHPVHCLAMELHATSALAPAARLVALRRTSAIISCVRAFAMALLDAGLVPRALALNEAVYRLSMSSVALRLNREHELSCVNALSIDPRLPASFLEVRYPAMLQSLAQQSATLQKRTRHAPEPVSFAPSYDVYRVEGVSVGAQGVLYSLRDSAGSHSQRAGLRGRTARIGDYVRVRSNGALQVISRETKRQRDQPAQD